MVAFVYMFILDSPYRDEINKAILKLHEDQFIKKHYKHWWKRPIYLDDGSLQDCTLKEPDKSTDIYHIYGIFVVLLVGMVLSFIIAAIEFLWNVRKISIEEKVQSNIL